MYNGYYSDKVCAVTGGSTGIGFGLGKGLLEAGAKAVYLAARTKSDLDKAVDSLKAYSGRVFGYVLDVTDYDSTEAFVYHIVNDQGRLDMMFNNAGIGAFGRTTWDLDEWKKVMDINFWGVVHGIKAALPVMIEQGGGHIINTSSIAGLVPIPYQTLYCAAKFAVAGISECMRWEYQKYGIAVSTICPGNVMTPIFEKLGRECPEDSITVEHATEWILERVAQKKGIIPVAEIAENFYELYMKQPDLCERILAEMEQIRYNELLEFVK